MNTQITCKLCGAQFFAYHNTKFCNNCKHKSWCINASKHYRKKYGYSRRVRKCLECHQNYIISANYQKYCKECIRDVHLNNLKKYYKNNTHKWFIYAKWYRETGRGKEYHKQYARFRRITEKLLVQQFTNEEWKEKLNRTNGICPKCNVYVGIDKLELDHIFPISKAEKGRIYTIDDIQPLCRKCNARKCNKL